MQIAQQVSTQKITPVIFKGSATEYFGIWIVNLLLSLITFGIYSAWAKVRRKKYFYNNTLIEGVGFDYHAKPLSILKGRVIAFIFFAAYGTSASIHPLLPAIFFILLSVAVPWLVVRGSLFNARNTSHRGLRFDFVGTVLEAGRVYLVIPLLSIMSLGLGAPYASHQKNEFLMGKHKFGLSQFHIKMKVKDFYMVYLKFFIIPLFIIGILAAIAIPAYQQYLKKAALDAKPHAQLIMPTNRANIQNAAKLVLADNTQAKPPENQQTMQEASPEPSPDADQNPSQNQSQAKAEKNSRQKMREMFKNPSAFIFILIPFAAYALIIFGFLGYMKARIGNLVWNNTTLDKLSFKSSLRARDYIWLYLSNIVAIMLTFGLATPWAQIRMVKYRASKLHIIGDVEFDQFVGDKKAEIKATGEEIADMFDVDLSFG